MMKTVFSYKYCQNKCINKTNNIPTICNSYFTGNITFIIVTKNTIVSIKLLQDIAIHCCQLL